jgi:hypothetical protein
VAFPGHHSSGDSVVATERTAAEIESRFREEQEYILRYVELLRSRLVVSSSDVWDVRGVLQSWALVPRKTRLEQERNPPELSSEELSRDVAELAKATPSINQAINEQHVILDGLFPDGAIPQLTSDEYEWADFLGGHYADCLLTMDHEEIVSQSLRQHEWQCADACRCRAPFRLPRRLCHRRGCR